MADIFAAPDSLPFISHYVQRRRKKRKSSLPTVVQRYFTDLTAAGGKYYSLSNPITLSEDYAFECEFVGSPSIVNQNISGASLSNRFEIVILGNTNELQIYSNGLIVSGVDATPFLDGRLHTLYIKSIANNIVVYVDDNNVGNGTSLSNSSIEFIGCRDTIGNTNYFNGIISGLKIWTGGDRNTGTLIADFPLDEDWTVDNIAHNRADLSNNATAENIADADAELFTQDGSDWLGEEFLTNGSFDTDTDWAKGTGWSISGGQAIQSGAPTTELLYQNVSRPAVYRLVVDVESISVDRVRFYDGAEYAYEVDQAGSYSFDVINQDTNYNFFTIRSDINTIANINSVSAKRLLQTA